MAAIDAAGAGAPAFLAERKAAISEELRRLTRERGRDLAAASPEGRELMERVLEYCLRGKMLRGALVGLGATLFSGEPPPGALEAAAAMELFQAGLLVHDDIMDGDEERRGAPTMHRAFAAREAAAGAAGPDRAGESLAVCAGDVCLFEGFAELARALAANPGASGAYRLCAEELSVVGLAQMSDVAWSSRPGEPSESEILSMYRCKTARYTFSLPLALGAALAGRPEAEPALFEIGAMMGVAFQLRDDVLGVFGETAATGKSASTDIREGKRTLLRARLFARARPDELGRLGAAFSRDAPDGEVAHVRERMEALGIREGIEAEARAAAEEAARLADRLAGARAPAKLLLRALADYLTSRVA